MVPSANIYPNLCNYLFLINVFIGTINISLIPISTTFSINYAGFPSISIDPNNLANYTKNYL